MFHLILPRGGRNYRVSSTRETAHRPVGTHRPRVRARAYHVDILLLMPKFHADSDKDFKDFKIKLAMKRGSLTTPPTWKNNEKLSSEYKGETRKLINEMERQIQPKEMLRIETPSKQDLLQALDIITEATKIIIFVGKNTASGHVQPDGAAAAALISNALVRVNKVPIIVSDEKNARMIKCIADKAPITYRDARIDVIEESGETSSTGLKIGKYLECHYIEAVNGILVGDLAQLIGTHQPDAAMFIGIPGSQSGKDECFDDEQRHIDDFNVAFDKALELCHFHEVPTIAICSSKNDVGMGGVTWKHADGAGTEHHAQQAATCTVFTQELSAGALALAELTTRSHNKKSLEANDVKELMEVANKKAEKGLRVTAYRQNPRYWRPGMPMVPARLIDTSHCLEKLNSIADAILNNAIDWPQRLQHFRDYGAPVQHLVLYDSSDGAFIAANDYLSFLRVNSNFDYKITIVTDHANAPYGELGEELFCVVVNGIHYAALQAPDAIVMVCNSACSKSLDEARKIVEEILKNAGINKNIEVINLIETTARMIVKKGGTRPVILCTEITAKNQAYEKAVEKELGSATPRKKISPYVIGCGNAQLNELMNKKLDWASIVNRLDYLKDDPAIKAEVKREIERYVKQMPDDTTVIVLACTHFPALMALLKESIKEHFTSIGRGDSIPEIIDPIKYQALETIKRLKNTKGADDLNTGIEVHTSDFKKFDDIKRSLIVHTRNMDVQALVGEKRNFRSGEIEGGDDDEYGGNSAGRRTTGFVTPNGIGLKQVVFDEVDIKALASKFGVDTKGNKSSAERSGKSRVPINEDSPASIED